MSTCSATRGSDRAVARVCITCGCVRSLGLSITISHGRWGSFRPVVSWSGGVEASRLIGSCGAAGSRPSASRTSTTSGSTTSTSLSSATAAASSSVHGTSSSRWPQWLAAALFMANPYCICKLMQAHRAIAHPSGRVLAGATGRPGGRDRVERPEDSVVLQVRHRPEKVAPTRKRPHGTESRFVAR